MKKRQSKQKGKDELLINALRATVLSAVLTLVLLLAVAALVSAGKVSEKLAEALILTAVIAATSIGGIYCASKQGGGVITAGAVSSLIYICAAILIGMMLPGRGEEGGMLLRVIIASVAGGTFGGVLKLKRGSKKSRLRKR